MSGTFFVFSDKKNKGDENIIYIGKNGDYNSLETYLKLVKGQDIYDFTKNHLSIKYFQDEDCFISMIHNNPLELRLQETLIPRDCLVISSIDLVLEDVIKDKDSYREFDYPIFSGKKFTIDNDDYRELVIENINLLTKILYQMIDSGFMELKNTNKVSDWIVTFQEPIQDIFIRYHRLETSAPDISTCDEFLINPEFRKTMCIMLMKVISNFLTNNDFLVGITFEDFQTWTNTDLWYYIRERLKLNI